MKEVCRDDRAARGELGHGGRSRRSAGRVLEKIGMGREGCRREHVRKWGRFVDVVVYGVLADEYGSAEPAAELPSS